MWFPPAKTLPSRHSRVGGNLTPESPALGSYATPPSARANARAQRRAGEERPPHCDICPFPNTPNPPTMKCHNVVMPRAAASQPPASDLSPPLPSAEERFPSPPSGGD